MTDKYRRLTHRSLLKMLDYNPRSGEFRWKHDGSRRPMPDGSIAGTIDKNGARVIAIRGRLYYAHRLAWFYVHKRWPNDSIDHKNMNPADNSIKNLRVATRSQNNANSVARSHNKSGLKGVLKHHNKYMAQITIKKRHVYLGLFETPQQAHAAYLAKARQAYGEFARGERP